MKQYIDKLKLAEKRYPEIAYLDGLLKVAGIPKIKPSDRLVKKWEGQIRMDDDTLEALPYWSWAIENNYQLPNILKISSFFVTGLKLSGPVKKVSHTDAYSALRDIVSKNDLRKAVTGVYHSKGYMVATDLHIMIRTKQPYFLEMEGKIYEPDALFGLIDEKFPDYENAIPESEEGNTLEATVDLIDLYRDVHAAKSVCKNIFFEGGICNIRIAKKSYFNTHLLEKILKALLRLGAAHAKIYQPRENRGLVIESLDKKHMGVIMPVMIHVGTRYHFDIDLPVVEIEELTLQPA